MNQKIEKSKSAKKIHNYYEIKEDRIIRKLKKCPRCGSFMALHKQHRLRWTCGSCSYTDYSGFKKKSN